MLKMGSVLKARVVALKLLAIILCLMTSTEAINNSTSSGDANAITTTTQPTPAPTTTVTPHSTLKRTTNKITTAPTTKTPTTNAATTQSSTIKTTTLKLSPPPPTTTTTTTTTSTTNAATTQSLTTKTTTLKLPPPPTTIITTRGRIIPTMLAQPPPNSQDKDAVDKQSDGEGSRKTRPQAGSFRPDPKSPIPVIIQEAGHWLPEFGKILAGSPNATQLSFIYQYLQGLKKLKVTPDSVLELIQALDDSHMFDSFKTTPIPNATQIPTTAYPFTSEWEVCAGDLEVMMNAFFSSELWALKMFDASGKPGHSILEGSRKFFGNYEECAGTESGPQVNRSRVEGNICRLAFDLDTSLNGFSLSRRYEWDLCMPRSCEGADLTWLANETLGTFAELSNIEVICTKDLDLYQDVGAISAICILTLLCLLTIAGTLIDLALAVENDGEENYVINAYATTGPKPIKEFVNHGFELKETSFKRVPPKTLPKPRPVSRVGELRSALDQQLQYTSSNGRGPSIHGGIGRSAMARPDSSASRSRRYQLDDEEEENREEEEEEEEETPLENIANTTMVNPMFMPGEDAFGAGDKESLREFAIGGRGDDDDDDDDNDDDKKDNTDSLPRWKQMLVAFSIPRNMKMILGVKPAKGSIRCIHGLKVLSMAWVVLGQTYNSVLKTFQNTSVSRNLISTVRGQMIYNATFAVDSLFLISGVLTAYMLLKECGKRKRIPGKTGIMYYAHRFWRLTPPYLLWMMVIATLLQYVGEGRPAWRDFNMADKCRDNWWINLLYVNNVYKNQEACITSSWYLANDMQFHFVAPLALIPWILGFRLVGFLITCVMVALHITTTIWLEVDIDGGDVIRNRSEYMYDIYVQPYARVAPYAVGLMAGWCLWKCKAKLDMNKYGTLAGWLVCLVGIVTLTLVTYDKNEDLQPDDSAWSVEGMAAFEGLSRPLWSLVVGWVVLACATGNGGFINSFLSWGGWLPLSRLTYCVYLVHATVISFEEAAVESVMFFTETLMVYRFFGFLVMSYLIGLILSLVAESPLIAVEKTLLPKSSRQMGSNMI